MERGKKAGVVVLMSNKIDFKIDFKTKRQKRDTT